MPLPELASMEDIKKLHAEHFGGEMVEMAVQMLARTASITEAPSGRYHRRRFQEDPSREREELASWLGSRRRRRQVAEEEEASSTVVEENRRRGTSPPPPARVQAPPPKKRDSL